MKLNHVFTHVCALGAGIGIGVCSLWAYENIESKLTMSKNANNYKRLAYECDMAMHEEVTIRQLEFEREQLPDMRLSADVGMLVCHEYDKLRKKMLSEGVSDNELAILGLEALENEQITVEQMVDSHRMDRM
ncbi:TIGR03982 family His-Xaa-Ser system protein [Salinicola lusitanus]|uniref:TIGR03982 family His-Xaa-Ser system protein n=1 Tax=Salinicola lusitanus TaxID=1949085 RepID=UPI0013002CD9|nr:TIGR03982 family His-Xaa-Ser system protein [Salinicola lusitanus]